MFKSPECGIADYFVQQNSIKYDGINERRNSKAMSVHTEKTSKQNTEIIHETGLKLFGI